MKSGDDVEVRVSHIISERLRDAAQSNTDRGVMSEAVRTVYRLYAEGDAFEIDEFPNPRDHGRGEYGPVPMPRDWPLRRSQVLERDDHTCQNCGIRNETGDVELDVHHIVPRDRGGKHHEGNLITLCDSCHSRVPDF